MKTVLPSQHKKTDNVIAESASAFTLFFWLYQRGALLLPRRCEAPSVIQYRTDRRSSGNLIRFLSRQPVASAAPPQIDMPVRHQVGALEPKLGQIAHQASDAGYLLC